MNSTELWSEEKLARLGLMPSPILSTSCPSWLYPTHLIDIPIIVIIIIVIVIIILINAISAIIFVIDVDTMFVSLTRMTQYSAVSQNLQLSTAIHRNTIIIVISYHGHDHHQ